MQCDDTSAQAEGDEISKGIRMRRKKRGKEEREKGVENLSMRQQCPTNMGATNTTGLSRTSGMRLKCGCGAMIRRMA